MSNDIIANRLNTAAQRSVTCIYDTLYALTEGSEPAICHSLHLHSNQFERLEFHGDTRLSAEINQIIIDTHSFMDPNFMTLISQNCICNANLTVVFEELNLEELFVTDFELTAKDKADVVESMLGELYTRINEPEIKKAYDALIHYIYHKGYMRAILRMQDTPKKKSKSSPQKVKRKFKYMLELYGNEVDLTPGLCGSLLKKKYKMHDIGYVQVDSNNIAYIPLTEKDARIICNYSSLNLMGKTCTFTLSSYNDKSAYCMIIKGLPSTINLNCLVAVIKGKYNLKEIGIIKLDKQACTALVPILNLGIVRASNIKRLQFSFNENYCDCEVTLLKTH